MGLNSILRNHKRITNIFRCLLDLLSLLLLFLLYVLGFPASARWHQELNLPRKFSAFLPLNGDTSRCIKLCRVLLCRVPLFRVPLCRVPLFRVPLFRVLLFRVPFCRVPLHLYNRSYRETFKSTNL